MRIPIWLAGVAALGAALLVVMIAQALLQPDQTLITDAAFDLESITPNADGNDDITTSGTVDADSRYVTFSVGWGTATVTSEALLTNLYGL